MLTAVVMAAVVILVACGSDSKNGRKKNPADNSDENLTLYYANSTWTDLFPEAAPATRWLILQKARRHN